MTSPIASIDKITEDTYRINIGMPDMIPGGFSFNQYLVVDEMPLLFHTGPKKLFPLVREQIETVLPLSSLRYLGVWLSAPRLPEHHDNQAQDWPQA